ncbi:hypothetical protein [Actinoplanes subtropicus]|uniref:hypothetical protein n=1 Tax=Actinoplanes subtropicus TaxID=543632 RepID=UPI0004C330E2|nr:hypothetical protein [Actinoplanes subtropicus]
MSENPPPNPDDAFTPPPYGQPAYGPSPYGPPVGPPPAYALPSQYYAGPEDPLVSRDIAGWWNRSLSLLKTAWLPLLLVYLISVPALEILIAWAQAGASNDIGPDAQEIAPSDLLHVLLRLGVALLVGGLLSTMVSLTAQGILVQAATGRRISIGAALRDGLRRTPALIGWGIPVGLMVVAGVFFCILPGLYLGAAFTVLPAVVLLERGNAISRSFQLLHADIGAALGRIVIYYGVSLLFAITQGIVTGGVGAIGTPVVATVTSTVLATVFTLAGSIVVAPMVLTAYADMRARREPFSTAYLSPAPPAE